MRTSSFPFLTAIVALISVAGSEAALGACAPKPNIVLIVADDLGPIELPFLNRPLRWVGGIPSGGTQFASEQKLTEPTRNRMPARLRANPGASDTATYASINSVCTAAGEPYRCCTGRATGSCTDSVVPLDRRASYASYKVGSQYGGCTNQDVDPMVDPLTAGSCQAATDILRGFGGLRRIADQGLVFDRFYANSARCEPDRSTVFSGRYTLRTGVRDNGNPMPGHELTMAEYLKQGCGPGPVCWGKSGAVACPCFDAAGDCGTAPCYTTGLVGKWHLGDKQGERPWEQGFDEFVGFQGKYRKYFSSTPLTCGPLHPSLRFCNESNRPCTTDGDCTPGTCGPPGTRHQYVGPDPDATNPCDGDGFLTNNECCGDADPGKPAKLSIKHLDKDVVKQGGSTDYKCNTDDPSGAACNYYTRVARDHAVNFIKRHSADTKPYFLVVTFTAPHGPTAAPKRTEAHYNTGQSQGTVERPTQPSDAAKHWAVIEELDAAVGRIVKAIEDEAAQDPTTATLVMFTSDHGRPGDGWGNPALRGGKKNVYEQGIRIGLVGGWFRGAQCSGSAPTWASTAMMSSQVDLFATIADAAGFGIAELPGSSVKVCSQSGESCAVSVCPSGAGTCLTKRLDGESMLGAFTTSTHDPRQYVFAEFIHDKKTVVRRPSAGAFGGVTGVCAYDSQNPNETLAAFQEGGTHATRRVRGASATACVSDANCNVPCTILGKVCNPGSGDPRFLTRCKSVKDCAGDPCGDAATVTCNKCMTPRWKFRGPGNQVTPSTSDALFDLASNPEEDERLNLASNATFSGVVGPLRQRLYDWNTCTSQNNPGDTDDCDD
jgi:arylsulfatase A-like enzyme